MILVISKRARWLGVMSKPKMLDTPLKLMNSMIAETKLGGTQKKVQNVEGTKLKRRIENVKAKR